MLWALRNGEPVRHSRQVPELRPNPPLHTSTVNTAGSALESPALEGACGLEGETQEASGAACAIRTRDKGCTENRAGAPDQLRLPGGGGIEGEIR